MGIYIFSEGLAVIDCCPGKDDHRLDFALFKYLFLHPLSLLLRIGEELKVIFMLLDFSIFHFEQAVPRERLYARVEAIYSVDKRLVQGRSEQDATVHQHLPEAKQPLCLFIPDLANLLDARITLVDYEDFVIVHVL